jgi:hypothetical protein
MEQYIQMLIPVDPDFAPDSSQIAAFFDMLADSFHFELDWNSRHLHPLRVFKLLSNAEIEKAIEASGPIKMFPRLDRINLQRTSEIPGAIEGIPRCVVAANGHWHPETSLIKISQSLWTPNRETLHCGISCDLRSEPVLTSNWWTEQGDDTGLLQFGDPASSTPSTGTFTHPISRINIEVPCAGSARFWVGFDFGVWLLSHLPEDFDLLDPALVRATEDHFGVRMAQAGRALP